MAGGRPTKLTAARREKLLAAIRAGCHREQAARVAGVAPATFYRWVARGEREGRGPYRDFIDALREAEAEAEVQAVFVLRQAMGYDNWRAALAYLERRHPERWRRRQTNEIVGLGGGPVQGEQLLRIDPSRFSDDELELIRALWERAVSEGDDPE
jgi:AcrR family transcriptional regulator